MRRLLQLAALLMFGGAALGWFLTAPAQPVDASALPEGDAAQGEAVFIASGCASCHKAPDSTEDLVLAGGQRFASDFGTFVAPNISTDPVHGIGAWSMADFARAVRQGVSPAGQHYFPAFPYVAYAQMRDQDVADLWAYMQTLPASPVASFAHEVGFPFNLRRAVGGWKLLYGTQPVILPPGDDPQLQRGQYLVEVLAHCGECHTPRSALGGLDYDRWLLGAPNPSGTGTIPALTPDKLTWSAIDIAYYLETGFTPAFDSVGGHMAAVVANFAKLPAEDRAAVAAYIKALPVP